LTALYGNHTAFPHREECAKKHIPASVPALTHASGAGSTAASSCPPSGRLVQAARVANTSCATWTRKKAAGSVSSARAITRVAKTPRRWGNTSRSAREADAGSEYSAHVSDYSYVCVRPVSRRFVRAHATAACVCLWPDSPHFGFEALAQLLVLAYVADTGADGAHSLAEVQRLDDVAFSAQRVLARLAQEAL
jgi:hypothetical protein